MAMSSYVRRLRSLVGRELLMLPSVAGIVFDGAGGILLVRQRDVGLWSTPGGAIEPDETPADAVVREIWEETGLVTRPVRILGVYGARTVEYPNGDLVSYVTTVFECEVVDGTLHRTSDEVSDAAFVRPDQLAEYPSTDWARRVLPALVPRQDRTVFEPATWRPVQA
jgi:8-oxo-dGTP pyrophosphatase MutT (NUDIX family)